MWKILTLLLIITYESTAYPQEGFSLSNSNLESDEIDDEIFLDENDWRENDKDLLKTLASMNMADCSYVENIIKTDFEKGYMEIVISPELQGFFSNGGQKIRIILQVPHEHGDMIKLYKGTELKGHPLFETEAPTSSVHHVDTNVIYNPGDDYIAEYVRKNGKKVVISKFNNFKPSWMSCMNATIGNRHLGKLFFPGTHDAGSYITADWWRYSIPLWKNYYNFVFTQEDSILSQLMQGARSFDLRLAKYNTKDIFYINHGIFKVRPFIHVLEQIKEFITHSPNEIILLDFHNFPVGFTSKEDHIELINFIKEKLGEHLIFWRPNAEKPWEVTLGKIWETEAARIIIAYNENLPQELKLFPGVHQIWGNKDTVSELVDYMDKFLPTNCDKADANMTSAQVELTGNSVKKYIATYSGLRTFASESNSLVTVEFTTGTWGNATQAVNVDFLASTGIVIKTAIRQNALRAKQGHICH